MNRYQCCVLCAHQLGAEVPILFGWRRRPRRAPIEMQTFFFLFLSQTWNWYKKLMWGWACVRGTYYLNVAPFIHSGQLSFKEKRWKKYLKYFRFWNCRFQLTGMKSQSTDEIVFYYCDNLESNSLCMLHNWHSGIKKSVLVANAQKRRVWCLFHSRRRRRRVLINPAWIIGAAAVWASNDPPLACWTRFIL